MIAAGVAVLLLVGGTSSAQAASSATIEGVVKDADGKPVAGATVYALSPDRGPGVKNKTRKATTNSKGRYRIKTSPAGWYQLKASADLGGPCKIKVGPRNPVKVKNGKKRTVNLTLPNLIEVTYRPVDEDGEFLTGVPVTGCAKRTEVDGQQGYRTYVKATAKHLDIRSYVHSSYKDVAGQTYRANAWRPTVRVPVSLPKRGTADLGEIRLAPSEGTGSVTGELKIIGSARDARIMLGKKGGGLFDYNVHTVLKKDRRFEFTEVPDGSYELRFEASTVRVPVTVRNGEPVDVGTVEVDLSGSINAITTVSKKVAEAGWCVMVRSNKAFSGLPGETFLAGECRGGWGDEENDDPAERRPGRRGTTIKHLGPGTYTVTIGDIRTTDRPGYVGKSVKVRVRSGEKAVVDFPKARIDARDRTVKGTVKNKAGKPPVRYALLYTDHDDYWGKVRVSSSGKFTFKKVSSHPMRIEFTNGFNEKNEWTSLGQVVAKAKVSAGSKNVRLKTVKVR